MPPVRPARSCLATLFPQNSLVPTLRRHCQLLLQGSGKPPLLGKQTWVHHSHLFVRPQSLSSCSSCRGTPSQVPRALERNAIPLPPAVEALADPRPSQQRPRRRPAVLGPGSSPRPSTAELAKTPTQDEVGNVPEAAGPASRPWPPHAGGAKSWCRLPVAAEQIPPNFKMSFIFNL